MKNDAPDLAPRWERGYRCHGFWVGEYRVGSVTSPPGRIRVKNLGYGWQFQSPHTYLSGNSWSLNKAKATVEKLYGEHYATDAAAWQEMHKRAQW